MIPASDGNIIQTTIINAGPPGPVLYPNEEKPTGGGEGRIIPTERESGIVRNIRLHGLTLGARKIRQPAAGQRRVRREVNGTIIRAAGRQRPGLMFTDDRGEIMIYLWNRGRVGRSGQWRGISGNGTLSSM